MVSAVAIGLILAMMVLAFVFIRKRDKEEM